MIDCVRSKARAIVSRGLDGQGRGHGKRREDNRPCSETDRTYQFRLIYYVIEPRENAMEINASKSNPIEIPCHRRTSSNAARRMLAHKRKVRNHATKRTRRLNSKSKRRSLTSHGAIDAAQITISNRRSAGAAKSIWATIIHDHQRPFLLYRHYKNIGTCPYTISTIIKSQTERCGH